MGIWVFLVHGNLESRDPVIDLLLLLLAYAKGL